VHNVEICLKFVPYCSMKYFLICRYGEKERTGSSSKLEGKGLLIATFKHMTKPYQILMIPLTIWAGMEQGYFGADFTNVSATRIIIEFIFEY